VTDLGLRYRLSIAWVMCVAYAIYLWNTYEAVRW